MSVLQDPGVKYTEVNSFGGPNLLMNDEDSPQPQCLSCRNVEFVQNQLRVRRGFTQVWNPNKILRVMYNWLQQAYNRLVYLNTDNNVISRDLTTGVETTLIAASSVNLAVVAGMTLLQAGYRLYMSFFDANGLGISNTRVWDGTITAGVPNVEPVFKRPLSVFSASSFPNGEIAAGGAGSGTAYSGGIHVWSTVVANTGGLVSTGLHGLALIGTTFNGYQQSPGPVLTSVGELQVDAVGVSAPAVVTVTVTPQATWPLWINTLQLAVTTVAGAVSSTGIGLRWYLLPGSTVTLVRGSATPAVFTFNLDDVTLAGGGPTEITDTLFNLYGQRLALFDATVSGGGLLQITVISNVGTITFSVLTDLRGFVSVGDHLLVLGSTTGALNAQYVVAGFPANNQATIVTSGVANGTYNNGALEVKVATSTGPVNPHCILSFNNRTVYICRLPGPDGTLLVGSILISEPNNSQWVTLNEHLLNLPEFRDTVTGFALGSVLYILGPSWTYAFTDNLRVPVLWAPPRLISGQIGSPFIRGVSANQDKGYAWVGDHSGLYFFAGTSYPIIPASYNQTPDWDRINFGAGANEFRVLESPSDRLVIVRAALDGATKSNYLLVWDYTYGVTADKIRYCGPWKISAFPSIGDIEIVQAVTSKVKELWISDGADGNVQRLKSIEAGDATENDPTALYDDYDNGIDAAYKYLTVSKAGDGPEMQIGGRFRLRGNGQINITARSFDGTQTETLPPITAGENALLPGKRFDRMVDMQSAAISYEFDNGAIAGSFFWLTAIRSYFTDWMGDYE